MAEAFDVIVIGSRTGRLCLRHPLFAARPEDGHCRAGRAGRHLPELGLHPHQGAAALVRDLPSHAPAGRVRLLRRQHQVRSLQDRRPLARRLQAAVERRRLPDEEAQDHRHRRRRHAGGAGQGERDQGRQDQRPHREEHRAGDRRARPHASGPGARRQADLDLSRGAGARCHAEEAAGGRLRRHRHRIRQLLPHPRRRGHRGRGAGPRAAGGRRRDFQAGREGLQEAGHEDPHRHHGREAGKGRRTTSPPR